MRKKISRMLRKAAVGSLSAQNLIICFVLLLGLSSTAAGQITIQYERWLSPTAVTSCVDSWDTDDNGALYLCGRILHTGSHWAIQVTRLDSNGNIDWQRDFRGTYSGTGVPFGSKGITVDPNGNVIAAGLSSSSWADPNEAEIVVMRYDSNGNAQWGAPVSVELYPYGMSPSGLELGVDESGFIYVLAMQGDSSNTPESRVEPGQNLLVAGIDATGAIMFVDVRNKEFLDEWNLDIEAELFTGANTATVLTHTLVDSVSCECGSDTCWDAEYQTSLLSYTHAGYQSTLSGPWKNNTCGVDHSCTIPFYSSFRMCKTVPRDIAVRPDGSIIIGLECGPYDTTSGALLSLTSGGDLEWIQDLQYGGVVRTVRSDAQGNTITSEISQLGERSICKYDRFGYLLWESPAYAGEIAVDEQGAVYLLGSNTITLIDSETGDVESTCEIFTPPTGYDDDFAFDTENRLFAVRSGGTGGVTVGLYRTNKRFRLLDATAENSPIAEREFEFYKADSSQPGFITDHIGTFSTDEDGAIEFDISVGEELMHNDVGTGLHLGDLAAFSKRVTSRTSERHPILLPTMYSLWLDPVKFDEYGVADLSSIDNYAVQDYVMDHTEYRYNLLVSVEWDADEVYLEGLRSEFRYMSNFLYDVSDGQIRLDTVAIYDNRTVWDQADVQIHASNVIWPESDPFGILSSQRVPIRMPRKWIGVMGAQRYETERLYPLGNPISQNFRTMGHEFGHYALGFFDEYRFVAPPGYVNTRCGGQPNYGFMDYQYLSSGELASEMSTVYRYADVACQNTEQWVWNGQQSCWDMFEHLAEGTFEGLYVPIRKPDLADEEEHVTPGGYDYVPGPNNTQEAPDYNVGSLVVFPVPIAAPADGVQSLHIHVPSASAGGVNVFLWQRDTDMHVTGLIDQGKTSDIGLLYVLGVNPFYDMIDASGRSWQLAPTANKVSMARSVERSWLVGDIDLSSGTSRIGASSSLSLAEDSVELVLYEVDGYFPMICNASLDGGNPTYTLQTPGALFPSDPSIIVIPDYGAVYNYVSSSGATGYQSSLTDSLGDAGIVRVTAEDNSAHEFFFTNKYELAPVSRDSMVTKVIGPDGGSELTLDTLNTGIDSVLILSSPYLVPLDGLAEDVAQGGKAHSISASPDVALAGVNSISIWYDEGDLSVGGDMIGDESALQIYHWNDQSLQWDLVGGYVDTSLNYVASSITEWGTYAAFTTNIVTDVEDDERGEVLPYRFELSQNYPNPFNPITTIEYSLPQRSNVRIDIFNLLGQKVQTIVNREQPAGSYSVIWDGTNTTGNAVSTGVYFYRFQAGDHVETKKMLLLK